jgi:hypothetical protein
MRRSGAKLKNYDRPPKSRIDITINDPFTDLDRGWTDLVG